jgi:hypothetical protein
MAGRRDGNGIVGSSEKRMETAKNIKRAAIILANTTHHDTLREGRPSRSLLSLFVVVVVLFVDLIGPSDLLPQQQQQAASSNSTITTKQNPSHHRTSPPPFVGCYLRLQLIYDSNEFITTILLFLIAARTILFGTPHSRTGRTGCTRIVTKSRSRGPTHRRRSHGLAGQFARIDGAFVVRFCLCVFVRACC